MNPWGRPALDGDINMETVNGLTLDEVQLCLECNREMPLDSVEVVVRSGSFIEATCRECKNKFDELSRVKCGNCSWDSWDSLTIQVMNESGASCPRCQGEEFLFFTPAGQVINGEQVVNFPDLARGILSLLGEEVSVNIEHTGGGTGTIFISADSSGLNTFAVGPASLSTGLALIEDLCWGIDGEEPVRYATEESNYSPESLAVAIVTDFLKVSPRGWVVTFSQEVHDAK
jgi:hypothetical protein